MNKTKLKQEGKKWVDDGIISDEQLQQILANYTKKVPNFIIILFAVILTGLGFLTFIMSEWAHVPHYSRILVIAIAMVVLYIIGHYLFREKSPLLGVSFITLSLFVFGAGMLLTLSNYQIELENAWPYVVWGIVGLLLYALYSHAFLFVLGVIIVTVGQIISGIEFSFNLLLLLLLILGYGHYTYHRANRLFGYIVAASYSISMLVLTMANEHQYYWLVVYYLILYIVGDLLNKEALTVSLKHISLLSIFILGMYQSFLLQEEFFMEKVEIEWSFLVIWILLVGISVTIKFMKNQRIELVDLVLFLPVFIVPFSYVIGLTSLFIFSIAWLFIGYKHENNEKVILGTIAFLLSTFTVYIQYAWEAMNKSLFFLIGGILLFLISFSLEKRRSTIKDK